MGRVVVPQGQREATFTTLPSPQGEGRLLASPFHLVRSVAGPIALASDKTTGDEVGLKEVINTVSTNARLVVPDSREECLHRTNGRLEKIFAEVILLLGAIGTLF